MTSNLAVHSLPEIQADVYSELRRMAMRRLSGNSLRSRISCTSLVHESILKLINRDELRSLDRRKQFFSTIAYVMRSVLVDLARRADCEHRHQLFLSVSAELDSSDFVDEERYLQLDTALSKLNNSDPDVGRVVHLRVFAGLQFAAIAEQLDISVRTAKRFWSYGKAWLRVELEDARQS